MIQRDKRYNLIKSLLSDGKIKVLSDIFDWVPKTIVSHDLGKKVYLKIKGQRTFLVQLLILLYQTFTYGRL
jgi:hypothetical protein